MRTHVAAGVIALLAGAAVAHLAKQHDAPMPPARPRSPRALAHFARTLDVSHFVRGNLHTHTNQSDGDASPEDVIRWYEAHGYDFLALTDHNKLSRPADYASLLTPDFALVPGEEVSMYVHGLQLHVNALCTHTAITGGEFPTAIDALEHALGEIRAQDGVAIVNHPNFDWALTESDILAADGADLIELASGHPYVHSAGDPTHPSHERLWDDALTAGHDLMGVAVDDTHHMLTDADPEAFPGVAWVEVFAHEPRTDVLCDALRQGALYASTGPELRRIKVTRETYEVLAVDEDATVVFVGDGGRTLARSEARETATYRLQGDEGYVRARVEGERGFAWTPAVRVVPPR